ncbi:unnamed protein product [Ranitomeya imitator]|uniref:Transmembrane protein 254 n=1 Tax=Ranitomeya imitator TaxID=111125 RepID=A0ABN9LIG1_9NEOB|nr:unnamed protein product [Ranitomeya imitator]
MALISPCNAVRLTRSHNAMGTNTGYRGPFTVLKLYIAYASAGVEPHIHHCNGRHHVTAHTGEAAARRGSSEGAGSKGITDSGTRVLWFVQTFLFGFASLSLLLSYKPGKKRR